MKINELSVADIEVQRNEAGEVRNPRGGVEDVDSLALTIQAFGRVIQPLLVGPKNKAGKYPLRDGHRRLAAIEWLASRQIEGNWTSVPCIITQEKGDAIELALMLAANTARSEIAPSRVGRAMVELSRAHSWDARKIAQHTGYKEQDVLTFCDLAHADARLQERVDGGDLSLTAFRLYLSKLPKAVQSEIAGMEKPTVERVRKAIRERSASNPERMIDDESLVERLNEAAAIIEGVLAAAPFDKSVRVRVLHRLQEIADMCGQSVETP